MDKVTARLFLIAAGVLGGGLLSSSSVSDPGDGQRKASPYRPTKMGGPAKNHYQLVWGVDNFKVQRTASGNLIRFSYRVIHPERAKVLGDKSATPYLVGQRSLAVLQVPVMDKVGQLRQASPPKAGQEYWMVFSNKGDVIKPGDRVNVVIGSFRVDGLMVN
jgi:hypothetical protein